MIARIAIGTLVALALVLALFEVVGYRLGPADTLCRRTERSSSTFWGDGPIGEEVNVTGSTDYTCGPCDEQIERHRRLVLSDVDEATTVQPCATA